MDKHTLQAVEFWGAATSAHQIDGKNTNQWSAWELAHASELAHAARGRYQAWLPVWPEIEAEATNPDNYVSGVANNHWNTYEADYDLLEQLNMNAYRFSIEWSRLEPAEGE
jgi:beta-glucosidase